MLDISHDTDPMLSAFCERREAGQPSPLDRANAALMRADQAASILTGNGENVSACLIDKALDRAALAANACAIAERKGEPKVAAAFAKRAEREALAIERLDRSARLEGLTRAAVFA